jgi:hypothetical protein
MRMVVPILLACALAAGACAAPSAPAPGGATLARASSSPWWLCDPPGLWEDRR